MDGSTFWRLVTKDETDLLGNLLEFLDNRKVPYCLLGDQAVNAYVEPVVSLDLDIAVAVENPHDLVDALRPSFRVTEHPHSINLNQPGSELRVQIQTDPRYAAFVQASERREVLGRPMKVACLEDVLSGKIWAAMDPERRRSKRQKDLADIARILESYPRLRAQIPEEVLRRLV